MPSLASFTVQRAKEGRGSSNWQLVERSPEEASACVCAHGPFMCVCSWVFSCRGCSDGSWKAVCCHSTPYYPVASREVCSWCPFFCFVNTHSHNSTSLFPMPAPYLLHPSITPHLAAHPSLSRKTPAVKVVALLLSNFSLFFGLPFDHLFALQNTFSQNIPTPWLAECIIGPALGELRIALINQLWSSLQKLHMFLTFEISCWSHGTIGSNTITKFPTMSGAVAGYDVIQLNSICLITLVYCIHSPLLSLSSTITHIIVYWKLDVKTLEGLL